MVVPAPDASDECLGGAYLHSCRVKVIDGDTFPSSRYQDLLSSLGVKELIFPMPHRVSRWKIHDHPSEPILRDKSAMFDCQRVA